MSIISHRTLLVIGILAILAVAPLAAVAQNTPNLPEATPEQSNFPWVYILLGVGGLCLLFFAAYFFIRRKSATNAYLDLAQPEVTSLPQAPTGPPVPSATVPSVYTSSAPVPQVVQKEEDGVRLGPDPVVPPSAPIFTPVTMPQASQASAAVNAKDSSSLLP